MIGIDDYSRAYKVPIADVLDALRKGREEHIEIVEEAQVEFRKQAIERLEEMLDSARRGQRVDVQVNLTVPVNHTAAYDNAIQTLELVQRTGDTTIELTSKEIEKFVRGNWEWSDQFLHSTRGYSTKAAYASVAKGI